MVNTEQINHAVFANITDVDSPEHFGESLDTMFDTFIESNAANTPELRKKTYSHYECLKKFLNAITG